MTTCRFLHPTIQYIHVHYSILTVHVSISAGFLQHYEFQGVE